MQSTAPGGTLTRPQRLDRLPVLFAVLGGAFLLAMVSALFLPELAGEALAE